MAGLPVASASEPKAEEFCWCAIPPYALAPQWARSNSAGRAPFLESAQFAPAKINETLVFGVTEGELGFHRS